MRPQTKCFTEEINLENIQRRKIEMQWQKAGLSVNREMFMHQSNKVTKLVRETRWQHFTASVNDAKKQKELVDLTSKLVHNVTCTKLPACTSDIELV